MKCAAGEKLDLTRARESRDGNDESDFKDMKLDCIQCEAYTYQTDPEHLHADCTPAPPHPGRDTYCGDDGEFNFTTGKCNCYSKYFSGDDCQTEFECQNGGTKKELETLTTAECRCSSDYFGDDCRFSKSCNGRGEYNETINRCECKAITDLPNEKTNTTRTEGFYGEDCSHKYVKCLGEFPFEIFPEILALRQIHKKTGSCDCQNKDVIDKIEGHTDGNGDYDCYYGEQCEETISEKGCKATAAALQKQIADSSNKNLELVVPTIFGISTASIVGGYTYLLRSSSHAESFSALEWRDHRWVIFSVGLKIFDLQSDWGFYFLSLRAESFEGHFKTSDNTLDSEGTPLARASGTGRYSAPVAAIQSVALVSCGIGTFLTFFDIWGSRQRLAGAVADLATAWKITLAVMFVEDVPQLAITLMYITEMSQISRLTSGLIMSDDEKKAKIAGDVISYLSLLASILNILYSMYLLYSDRKSTRLSKERNEDLSDTDNYIARKLAEQAAELNAKHEKAVSSKLAAAEAEHAKAVSSAKRMVKTKLEALAKAEERHEARTLSLTGKLEDAEERFHEIKSELEMSVL